MDDRTIRAARRGPRSRRLLATLAVALPLGALAGACAPAPPPPKALEAPFTCQQFVDADGWVKILSVLRYFEPGELQEALDEMGWDGLLAELEGGCTANPSEVIDPEYDAENPDKKGGEDEGSPKKP